MSITMSDVTVMADGAKHTITPTGAPAGASVVVDDNDGGYTEKGVYTISATVTAPNYNDWSGEAKLTILDKATEKFIIENGENTSDNDLADEWKIQYYHWQDGWKDFAGANGITLDNRVAKVEGVDNSNALLLTHSNQNANFIFSKTISVNDPTSIYNTISVDLRNISATDQKVQLQFKLGNLPESMKDYRGVWATIVLAEKLPRGWTHYDVRLDDSGWVVKDGTHQFNMAEALSALHLEAKDLVNYMSPISLLIQGGSDYNTAYTLMDNFEISYKETESTSYSIVKPNGDYYSYGLTKDQLLKLHISNNEASLSLAGQSLGTANVSFNGTELTVEYPDTFKYVATVDEACDTLTQTELTFGDAGQTYEEMLPETLNFGRAIVRDYQEFTADQELVDSEWEQVKYTTDWVDAGKQIRVRHAENNYFLNMFAGYSTSFRYTYAPSQGFGKVTHVSFSYGNDYSGGSHDVKVKVSLVRKGGNITYLAGDASNWITIPANTPKWTDFRVDGLNLSDVIGFRVTTNAANTSYLYMDNLVIGDVATPFESPKPVENHGFTLDFADCHSGSKLETNWETKKYDNGWKVVTSQINQKDGFVNFYAGWQTDFIYTYTPTEPIGTVNHFSVDLGNYYSTNGIVKVKVWLQNGSGEKTFIVGSSSAYEQLPANLGSAGNLTTMSFSFTEVSDATQLCLQVKGSVNGDTYLYCDNVVLSYVEPAPVEKHGFVLDFANCKSGSKLEDATWETKKNTGTAWSVVSSQINQKDGFINFYAGWQTDFIYSYTPTEKIGTVNHFSVDLGNYYSGNGKVYIKAWLENASGTRTYIYGDASTKAEIPANLGAQGSLVNFETDFTETSDAVKLCLYVKGSVNADSYLYCDNIVLSYTK